MPKIRPPLHSVAAVFGGSRGIGKAIAEYFLRDGHRVAILSRNKRNLDSCLSHLQSDVKNLSTKLLGLQCDVTKETDVQKCVQEIQSTLGPCTILVNAAGINKDAIVLRTNAQDIADQVNTNLVGPMLTCKAVLKNMMEMRTGCIMNIGSIVGSKGNTGQSVYSATKSGLVGFTKSLAKEMAGFGIRVNVIEPGFINTDMTMNLKEAHRESLRKAIPLERFGEAAEIAEVAKFLITAKYITGQVIVVDGGLSLCL